MIGPKQYFQYMRDLEGALREYAKCRVCGKTHVPKLHDVGITDYRNGSAEYEDNIFFRCDCPNCGHERIFFSATTSTRRCG